MNQECAVGYASEADIDAWMDLVALVRDAFPGLSLGEYRGNLRKAIAERRALCAKDARGLLGVLVLSDQHNGIGFLAVHPEARGRGVASALVRMMLDVLPADQDIFVTTYREDDPLGAAPRALYKRLGFEEAELVTRYGHPCQQFALRRGSGDKYRQSRRYARPRQAHGRAFDSAKHCANAGWSRSSFGNLGSVCRNDVF